MVPGYSKVLPTYNDTRELLLGWLRHRDRIFINQRIAEGDRVGLAEDLFTAGLNDELSIDVEFQQSANLRVAMNMVRA